MSSSRDIKFGIYRPPGLVGECVVPCVPSDEVQNSVGTKALNKGWAPSTESESVKCLLMSRATRGHSSMAGVYFGVL